MRSVTVRARTRAALWVASAALTLVGGFIAAILVSAGLCEDDDSYGSDGYCNGGGMEAALIAILIDVVAVIAAPALALFWGRERAFKAALLVPLLGLPLILLATQILGTDA
jgi:hypothetical protein